MILSSHWSRVTVAAALLVSVAGSACVPAVEQPFGPSTTSSPLPLEIETRVVRSLGSPSSLPSERLLIASGNTGPITWTIERGRLPDWITLSRTGVFESTGVEPNPVTTPDGETFTPEREPLPQMIQVRATSGAQSATGLIYFDPFDLLHEAAPASRLPAGTSRRLPEGTEIVVNDQFHFERFRITSDGSPAVVSEEHAAEQIGRWLGSPTHDGPVVALESEWPGQPEEPSGSIDYLDGRTGATIRRVPLAGQSHFGYSLEFRFVSPTRTHAVATPLKSSNLSELRLVDLTSGQIVHDFSPQVAGYWTWSSDGRWIVTRNNSGMIYATNLERGSTFEPHLIDVPGENCWPISVTSNDRVSSLCYADRESDPLMTPRVYSSRLDGGPPNVLIELPSSPTQRKPAGSLCTTNEFASYSSLGPPSRPFVVSPSGRYLVLTERCSAFAWTGTSSASQLAIVDLIDGGAITPVLKPWIFQPSPGVFNDTQMPIYQPLYWR